MKWSSAISGAASLEDAISECSNSIESEFVGPRADLVIVFVSPHYSKEFEDLSALVKKQFGEGVLLGCSGDGVIGAGIEVEHQPGFAMTVAHLPGVEITPFRVENESIPNEDAPPNSWETLFGVRADTNPQFVLLADPFSISTENLLSGLDYAFPNGVKIGGLASGSRQPGGNALYLGDEFISNGMVGISLHGNITLDTIVAQGCRPIGRPMHVTTCSDNVLLSLEGQTAIDALRQVFAGLSQRDQDLSRHSLFLGINMDPLIESPQHGDYLIRNILDIDRSVGGLAVGAILHEGQVVQFHLRDSETSSHDLQALLTKYGEENPIYEDTGSLLFQCLGRGSYLYGHPNHDTEMFRKKINSMPLTGFFCNGEIGPVGKTTFMHGYTSSFGIFRPNHQEKLRKL